MMFSVGDFVNIENSDHPNVVHFRRKFGVGPHKVIAVELGYLKIRLSSSYEALLWLDQVEKVAGFVDQTIPLKQAYAANKDREWCCRCGKETIRIKIGAGFQFCPCTDPSWKGSWPT